ncbi:MAG: hypothetical protein H8E17_08600 [Deltaproteobacteria bacterium]|nr:hypothetical protein [Deltaproteobacteria bacterium]
MKTLKIEIGQKWIAKCDDIDKNLEWVFEIVAILKKNGARYFLGVKHFVDFRESGCFVLFDRYGHQANKDLHGAPLGYYLIALAALKKTYL